MTGLALRLRIVGLPAVKHALAELNAGAEASEGSGTSAPVRVVAAAPYAYGIETGRHRSGRLARRAGGVFYLARALDAHKPRVKRTLADALPDGGAAVLRAWEGLGQAIETDARRMVVVRSGALRGSIQMVSPGREPVPFLRGTRLRRPR